MYAAYALERTGELIFLLKINFRMRNRIVLFQEYYINQLIFTRQSQRLADVVVLFARLIYRQDVVFDEWRNVGSFGCRLCR